jgi:hypothetical protein
MRTRIAYAILPRLFKVDVTEPLAIPKLYREYTDIFSKKDTTKLLPIEGR